MISRLHKGKSYESTRFDIQAKIENLMPVRLTHRFRNESTGDPNFHIPYGIICCKYDYPRVKM